MIVLGNRPGELMQPQAGGDSHRRFRLAAKHWLSRAAGLQFLETCVLAFGAAAEAFEDPG
jgi:hypothetical protein